MTLKTAVCLPSFVSQCGRWSWQTAASSEDLISNSIPAAILPADWRRLSSHWTVLYSSSASWVITNTNPVKAHWNTPGPGHLNLQDTERPITTSCLPVSPMMCWVQACRLHVFSYLRRLIWHVLNQIFLQPVNPVVKQTDHWSFRWSIRHRDLKLYIKQQQLIWQEFTTILHPIGPDCCLWIWVRVRVRWWLLIWLWWYRTLLPPFENFSLSWLSYVLFEGWCPEVNLSYVICYML